MNQELRIIFFGTPAFVLPVLKKLQENFEVVGVVTTKSQQGEALRRHIWGRLMCLTPETLDQNFVNQLQALNPELFVVASYGKIIHQAVLDIPKFGSLNIHPSLLPKYRGPSPIQTAILNGDKISGVSILVVDSKMDHGPVVATCKVGLSNTDTFDSLSKTMFLIGAELLIKIIPDFVENKIKLQEQDHEKATFTKMFTKEDGYFDLFDGKRALPDFLERLDKMIRAFYPWPTAWTLWLPQSSHSHARKASPYVRKIVKFLPEGMVQMEGKKPVKFSDFLRGYPNFPVKNQLS